MQLFVPPGLGWRPDLPDHGDFTPDRPEISELLGGMKPISSLPASVDWREFFDLVQDQGHLDTSVAHACAALLEYFELRASGRLLRPSRLFLDSVSRRLAGDRTDGGVGLRTAWKAILRFGMPREEHWPYAAELAHREPDAFVFSSARRFPDLRYVRLDPSGAAGDEVLDGVRSFLAAGFCCVFGFSVCTSLSTDPDIPLPTVYDHVRGGQAVVALGYDDARRYRSERGALLVRSSWGRDWGDEGYGWIPYAYVERRLAADFWTLVAPDWLASGEFHRPR